MPFQSTVFADQTYGFPGDFYEKGPNRVETFTLESPDEVNNVFGNAFTVLSQKVARAGGTGDFAGILVNPKEHASYGTSTGGPLAPTLNLANYSDAALCRMGVIFVTLPTAANIGDLVVFNTTTGVLSTVAPGAPLPVGTAFAYAKVVKFTVAAAGLAVIEITETPVAPV